jgi:hypothetical protein
MVRGKRGALEGLRVLDLTWVYAGPFATRLFAEGVIYKEPAVDRLDEELKRLKEN